MRVYIKSVLVNYEITFNKKFLILGGKSGSGKTSIMDFFNGTYECEVDSDLPFHILYANKDSDIDKMLHSKTKCIYYVDENYMSDDKLTLAGIIDKFIKSDNYYIIAYRDNINIPVRLVEFKELILNENTNTNESVDLYSIRNSEDTFRVNRIVTEDSKSGNILLSNYFDNVECVGNDTGGYKKIPGFITNSIFQGITLLVYDSLLPFKYEQYILEAIKESEYKWYKFCPECIEKYILYSPFAKRFGNCPLLMCEEEERESEFYKIIAYWFPLRYVKYQCSDCILKECGEANKDRCEHCRIKDCKDKRKEIIYGALSRVIVE